MPSWYALPMSEQRAANDSTQHNVTALPATALVIAARDSLAPVLPPVLFAHSVRTFLYARAWARAARMAFDEEGLLVASLFHDAGLCAPFKDTRRAFQINSSAAMRDLLVQRGLEAPRVARLTNAVLHHFQPVPRWRYGPEAGLLHIGAYLDAIGLRAWRIPAARRAIRSEYPPHRSSRQLFGLIARSIRGARSCVGIMLPELFAGPESAIDT